MPPAVHDTIERIADHKAETYYGTARQPLSPHRDAALGGAFCN
jgi:hypothetical protein